MNKEALLEAFKRAADAKQPYVFVVVEAEGIKECIVIPKESFKAKETFYTNAYGDDLVHVMNSNVRILDCGYGQAERLPEFV